MLSETDVSGLRIGPIFESHWTASPLKLEPIGSPETSISDRLTPHSNTRRWNSVELPRKSKFSHTAGSINTKLTISRLSFFTGHVCRNVSFELCFKTLKFYEVGFVHP